MILYLTFAAWCFAHLDDIAARFVGWLFTPFSYGGRHRKAWRELSDWDAGGDAIREQGWDLTAYYYDAVYLEGVRSESRAAIAAAVAPAPLCPPMYATLAEHGKPKPPPIDYSAYTDHQVTAPVLPRPYVLGLTDEGEIPVAQVGTWRPAGVDEDGEPETPGQLTPQAAVGELVEVAT